MRVTLIEGRVAAIRRLAVVVDAEIARNGVGPCGEFGFVLEGPCALDDAYEYFLNPFMGVGVEGQFGYHYLVGASGTVNNSADHSSGYHIMGLGSFIFHLGR